MSASSLTSVLLPIFNGEAYLAPALFSTLSQELPELEVIVLNDGSSDSSEVIISSIADPRLRKFYHSNVGLSATLNRGIALSLGHYIARQDQDDLMLPGRLAMQRAFLDANPNVAMVGTWAQIYEANEPTNRYHRHPTSPDTLKLRLLFDNPFVHSSMMIRAEVLREVGGYSEDKERQPPEDYELWSRIARTHDVANLPEVLTVYREMPGSMSRDGASPFLPKILRIAAENLHHLIGARYDVEMCMSLACVYHNAPKAPRALKMTEALRMVQAAIEAIVPTGQQASAEFLTDASRLRRHIVSRYLRKHIPGRLLAPARWLRSRLFDRSAD